MPTHASLSHAPILLFALRAFSAPQFEEVLVKTQPPAVTPDQKAAILAALPQQERVRELDGAGRRKLDALAPIFDLFGRRGVYEVVVYDYRPAYTGLHARAVVVISNTALRLLDVAELQSLAAHEAAHEFFWNDYYQAREQKDAAALRRLEVLCDALAVVKLEAAGVDPNKLISAVEKQARYNRERFGLALNEESYPPLEVRKKSIRDAIAWARRAK